MARAATARSLPAPARPRARAKAKPARKPAPRTRVAGGVFWIGLVAVLLAGVVALNVAVLRLNVRLDDLGREQSKLRGDNANLQSQIASRAASGRIVALANGRLGLTYAGDNGTFLDLRK